VAVYRQSTVTFLRAIAAVLIVLGCAAFSQTCLIATMVDEQSVDCCEHEQPGGQAGQKECAQCLTLESGVNRVAPELVAVIEPVATADELHSSLFALAMKGAEVAPALDTSQAFGLTVLWNFVVRTALPVRGPSLIA
jgi:hypothetical protein